MFHTILITYELTAREYSSVFKAFQEYSSGKKFYRLKKTNTYICEASKDKGVIWYLKSNDTNSDYRYYAIEAKINPKIIIGKKDYVSVASYDDVKEMMIEFNKLSKNIYELLPKFSQYKIQRVDYCINIDVGGFKAAPDKIMELIKRSDKPSILDLWTEYDKKSKRKKPEKHSYYLINDSIHINCYYKFKELEEEFPECPNIEDSKNIIRFEVQCLSQKLSKIKKKFKIKEDEDEKLLLPDICEYIIRSYYRKTIGFGDYKTLKKAKELVNKSSYTEIKKKKMIKALELINKKRSIWKARKSSKSKGEISDFNKSLIKLMKLDINPVTIPKGWNISSIPNLIKEIDLEFNE